MGKDNEGRGNTTQFAEINSKLKSIYQSLRPGLDSTEVLSRKPNSDLLMDATQTHALHNSTNVCVEVLSLYYKIRDILK